MKRITIWSGLTALLMLALACGGPSAYQQTADAQYAPTGTARAAAASLGAALERSARDACNNANGFAGAGAYSPSAPNKVFVADLDLSTHIEYANDDARYVAHAWEATSEAEAQIVVCISRTSDGVETCKYNEGHLLTREVRTVTVRILAFQTGQELDSKSFEGKEPRSCPNQFDFTLKEQTILGDLPDPTEVNAWIQRAIHQ